MGPYKTVLMMGYGTCSFRSNMESSLATDHILMQTQVFSKRKLGVALKCDQLLVGKLSLKYLLSTS